MQKRKDAGKGGYRTGGSRKEGMKWKDKENEELIRGNMKVM